MTILRESTFDCPKRAAPAIARSSVSRIQRAPEWVAFAFLLIQFASQAMLMIESLGGLRMYFRAAAFFSSICMFFVLRPVRVPQHPSCSTAIAFLIVLSLGILQPEAHFIAGFAQWWLNFAILSPLFWASRIAVTSGTLVRLLMFLWAFNLLSSAVGVLQVYYPESFAPSGNFVRDLVGQNADGLLIELANGRQVFRPFGLSDTPGGAASAGAFSVLMGVLLMSTARWHTRILALIGIGLGAFCLYLCQVRSLMISTVISVTVLVGIQFLQGRITRVIVAMILVPVIGAGVFAWSISTGGQQVAKRIRTLSEGSIKDVYYTNRGKFLDVSINEETLKYPVGAGLGRYGMMYSYFGDKRSIASPPLWAEIQYTGWLYDGGILLVCLGYVGVLCATYYSIRAALQRTHGRVLSDAAALIAASNVSWLAITFNYPVFVGQTGVVFWFLNAALFEAIQSAVPTNRSAHAKLLYPARKADARLTKVRGPRADKAVLDNIQQTLSQTDMPDAGSGR